MIRIGVAQIKNTISLKLNFESISKCLNVFAESNADIIIFPECALSGFSAKIGDCSIDKISPYLEHIRLWSKTHNKAVLLPTAIQEDKIFNSGFYFHNDEVKRFYKIGLTESEKKFFAVPDNYKKEIFKIKDTRFLPLICFEAQMDPFQFFNQGDVDFILWPGYWGWEEKDKWESYKNQEELNLIYKNVESWRIPIIQSNFAMNDLKDNRGIGPLGLSVVVNYDNNLSYRGKFKSEDCFIVEINNQSVLNCFPLNCQF